mmetsp:Transcript_21538/g.47008  ORF Transcript_21538/g.47008 Transcript_21538/m.47008 type:complete len:226 (+) Transcript_21538:1567-2244(+)
MRQHGNPQADGIRIAAARCFRVPLPLVHGLEFFVVQKIIVVVATGTGIDADTGIAPIRQGRPAIVVTRPSLAGIIVLVIVLAVIIRRRSNAGDDFPQLGIRLFDGRPELPQHQSGLPVPALLGQPPRRFRQVQKSHKHKGTGDDRKAQHVPPAGFRHQVIQDPVDHSRKELPKGDQERVDRYQLSPHGRHGHLGNVDGGRERGHPDAQSQNDSTHHQGLVSIGKH